MSWINNILGNESDNNSKLADKELAMDMLTTSKADITMLSSALTETSSPQLRATLTNQLNACINEHFKLADMAAQKGWYTPYASPGQQIKQDLQEAQNILNNQNQQQ
jgi:similar to spore coat protein